MRTPMSDAERKQKRDYFRKRYREDPEYREAYKARGRQWKAKKLAECPEYKTLGTMRGEAHRLRESIKFHTKRILLTNNRLVKLAREIRKLEIKCREVERTGP